ncbi:MAG: hypothetical protein KKH52_00675 [Nanoarchaeota archaeon]|nr:hypothetical protein [Nanoarchaeota archaeon]MBU1622519.1 hypothetical protein [Nanoarchaeota archaeon]MBU1973890.1 hypothetical protein [Nanoarchaeota archaeon]
MHNYIIIKEKNKKSLLKKIKEAQKKKLTTVYAVSSEEMLRFALEKSNIDMIMGMEQINPREHTHYVRSGLDQVTCKIAALREKVIAFDFVDLLESKDLGKLIARMSFNLKLCRKYKVKTLFFDSSGKYAEKDLAAFCRVLEKS